MDDVKKIKITPSKAKEWLKRNTFNRRINRRHVEFLKTQIQNGDWVFNCQTIIFDNEGILLDGQHRLTAISELNAGYIESLVAFNAKKEVFHAIDQNKTRTNRDALFIAGFSYSQTLPSIIRLLEFYTTGKKYGKNYTNAKIIDLANNYDDGIYESVSFAHKFNKRNALTVSVVGACHYIFNRISREETKKFFLALEGGEVLIRGNPLLVLRDYILRAKSKDHRAYEWVRIIVYVWNCCRRKKKLKILKAEPASKRREFAI